MCRREKCRLSWLKPSDWEKAMLLVWESFLAYEGEIYKEEGIKHFSEFITSKRLKEEFLRGECKVMAAYLEDRIVGIGSIRHINQLSLLFVDKDMQRQGIGRAILERLCAYLKEEASQTQMRLMAAPGAVEFYRKNGFFALTKELETDGIRVTIMGKYL